MSKILDTASAGDWQELSDLWLSGLTEGISADDMTGTLRILTENGQEERAVELLEIALEEMSAGEDGRLPVLLRGAASIVGGSQRLRKALVESIRDEYLMFMPLENFLRLSGLMTEGADVRSSWAAFLQLMRYSSGGYIYHRTFGPGRIERVSRTSLSIEFQKDPRHDMRLDVALDSTIPLDPDSLVVMRWRDPEGFSETFSSDPQTFLDRAFAEPFGSPGEITQEDLKPVLEGTGISLTEGWKSLRAAAASSPRFTDLGDRITAKEEEDDPPIQIRRIITDRKTPVSLMVLEIQSLLDSADDLDPQVANELLEEVSTSSRPETGALFELCWILAQKGNHPDFQGSAARFVEMTSARCGRAVGEIHSPSCRRKYLDMFLSSSTSDDEKLHLLSQLKRPLWEYSASFLGRMSPELTMQNLQHFLSSRRDVDRFIWALCFIAENRDFMIEEHNGQLAETILSDFPFASADTQKKAAGTLTGPLDDEFRSYLEKIDTRLLSDHLSSLDGSSTAHREGIYLAVNREVSRRKPSDNFTRLTTNFWESGSLYSSREAIEKRRNDCIKLKQVEIPAAAEAVGVAASHGDLSENAEYTAALERRDLLLDRLKRWTDELDRYLPYPASEISTDTVSPGTIVRLSSIGGEDPGDTRVLQVVGPLDADPGLNRINYLAPVARAILGRTTEDRFVLPDDPHREWEIEEISILNELVTV